MADKSLKIGIIGAGIGGLAAASALSRMSVDVTVFEQAEAFSRVGAGIHVAPNAVKILRGLGLADEVVRKHAFYVRLKRYREYDTGEISAELPLNDSAEHFGDDYTTWHRGDLHAALVTLVPSELVQLGRKVAGLASVGSRVVIEFADGSVSTPFDGVIAADGIHSVTRDLLFSVAEPRYTKRLAYRSVIRRSDVQVPDLDPACKWWGPDRHFVHYHVSGGSELAFTTSVEDERFTAESWSAVGDLQTLRDAFIEFHPHVQAVLQACDHAPHVWAIHTHSPLPVWTTDRVALLGDACHSMTPYMGQGGAMAMEDAIILSRCIADVSWDPDGLPEALARYEETRKPRTSAIQATSEANTWGRNSIEADWVYGYNAWEVPLGAPAERWTTSGAA